MAEWAHGESWGSIKADLRDVISELGIVTEMEFEEAVTAAMDARNRFPNRSCLSAHQRVFGSEIRLPGTMLTDNPINRVLVATDPSTNIARTNEIRRSARRAYMENADKRAIAAAQRARSRKPPEEKIRDGSVVYVWRSNPRSGIRGWVGPGLVVCMNATETSCWISMRGVVVKCSREREFAWPPTRNG